MECKLPYIEHHIAVRLDHCIVVVGGLLFDDAFQCFEINDCDVWLYNLFLEQWKKYQIPKQRQVPPNLVGACGIVIGKAIYTFGGYEKDHSKSNEVWKLTRNTNSSFEWNKILVKHKKKIPSPRTWHSGWEYDGKLWTFGGSGPSLLDYRNEYGDFVPWEILSNQLFHFNPVSNEWTNLKCFGTVPSPRSHHATTSLGNKAWLYGGAIMDIHYDIDDLYELDMCSVTWTQIQTTTPKPPRLSACSLNVTRKNKVLLYCRSSDEKDDKCECAWILDLSSYSWKKYAHDDCCRTGSLGINNSIIIIGGNCPQDDLVQDPRICTPVCSVMLEPKTLQQLSIQTVYKYRDHLPWDNLPPKLIKLMQ